MRTYLSILIAVVCTLLLAPAAAAQGVKSVRGESTFYGESTHSLADCKRYALEQARIAALAKEFGTTISQDVYQRDIQSGSGESNYFSMLNRTEVNGEWLSDDGEPEYTVSHDADHNLIVKCVVRGKARRLTNEAAAFEASVLRNGNEPRFADTHFREGDEMKLYFRSPVNGYLTVYLVDDKRNVYSILPYSTGGDGIIRVTRDKDYVFFDTLKGDPQYGDPDELVMTVDGDVERNQVYVLFSPNNFNRATDRSAGAGMPRTLSYDDFTKWLSTSRKRDPKMGMKVMHLEITR
ncbi:MAG: DUF4384 domain-containing protein [Muribaculaceae bacterium]|nr:DUF4384 domain-containing protein [Muribaculaceae bacterium]